jgi:protein-L-isoaspartate(D-aspartate) O-methyltransferase
VARTNQELIQELIDAGYLKSPLLIEAFRAMDRRNFVPEELKDSAYVNEPLPIGFGQTISQPLTVAFMLELLEPAPNEKILDVGTGSGWQAALLAHIVAKEFQEGDESTINPKVISIERVRELAAFAEQNLSKYNFIEKGIVELMVGDASAGVQPELLPVYGFDKIIAAASAQEIPLEWKRQLAVGGRIVAPVGSSVMVVDKHGLDQFESREYPGFAFVPLVSE